MLHRLAIILITGFWLVMTALLIVRELYPESTRLNQVPLSYVAQVAFQHQQSSDLRIFSSEKDPGFLHVQPHTLPGTGRRVLEFNGSVHFTLPTGKKQRVSWIGGQYHRRNSAGIPSNWPSARARTSGDGKRIGKIV